MTIDFKKPIEVVHLAEKHNCQYVYNAKVISIFRENAWIIYTDGNMVEQHAVINKQGLFCAPTHSGWSIKNKTIKVTKWVIIAHGKNKSSILYDSEEEARAAALVIYKYYDKVGVFPVNYEF